MSLARSLLTPLTGAVRPAATFTAPSTLSAGAALAGVVGAVAVSQALLVPFMHAAAATAAAGLDPDVVSAAILVNALVLTPTGAGMAAVATATLFWTFPLFAGHQTNWRRCLLVAAGVGGVEVGRSLFIVGVLWLREATGLADPRYTVLTGLDALLLGVPGLPAAIELAARRVGLFELWAVAVAIVGLHRLEGLPRRLAVVTALLTALLMHGAGLAVELSRS